MEEQKRVQEDEIVTYSNAEPALKELDLKALLQSSKAAIARAAAEVLAEQEAAALLATSHNSHSSHSSSSSW